MIPAAMLSTCNLQRIDSNLGHETDYPEVLKSLQVLQPNVRMALQILPLPLPLPRKVFPVLDIGRSVYHFLQYAMVGILILATLL